jgi:hypothetical protein
MIVQFTTSAATTYVPSLDPFSWPNDEILWGILGVL